MIPILSDQARGALDRLARERALLAFDFDGTLVPIVDRPEDAAIPASTRELLRVVSLLYPCAIVSGRARRDVASRLEGIPLVAVVGNHGAEAGFGPVDGSRRALVCAWKAELARSLAGMAGVAVEDKGHSLAVHHRAAPDSASVGGRIRAIAAALPSARVFGGHEVVNVVPADAPHKGAAVEEILRRIGWREAMYAGDDVTDEDAFSARGVTVSVRVGRSDASCASHFVPEQAAVDDLLCALAAARVRADGREAHVAGLVRAAGGCTGAPSRGLSR